jgi:tetratricopeptide (TPR) repeat protein
VFVAVFFVIYSLLGWNNISWGLLWWTICIAPYLNIFRMQQELAERYVYLANVGLMFVLANLIINYPFIITAFLVFYATRLYYYMPAYTDDYWLIEYSVREEPGSWFAWHLRGHKRLEQGCLREALNMFVMAKMLSPKEFKILFNIGIILKMIKQDKEAERFFEEAAKNIIEGQEIEAKNLLYEAKTGKLPLLL